MRANNSQQTTVQYHQPLEAWDISDYATVGDPLYPATAKLHKSRVSPLVAVARGYKAMVSGSTDFNDFLASTYGSGTSKTKNAVRGHANNADLLYLPNYALDSVAERRAFDPSHRPSGIAHQYRPSNPKKNDQGKRLKYVFDSGTQTVLDVHPSTPNSYLKNPANVLFTEGIIKGDSTLTAYLRSQGFSADDLKVATHSANPDQAIHDMMETVPAEDRLLIVSIAGVYNWKSNPEWTVLRLKDSTAWLAFDGDLGVNRDVWDQTTKLMDFLKRSRRMSDDKVLLVDLASVPVAHDEDKVGLDDFFAEHGTFDDLPAMLTDTVPDPPQKDIEAFVGQHRMNESTTALQKCYPADEMSPARWADIVGIGARLMRTSVYRQPTVDEEDSWSIAGSSNVEADRREVVVELGYLDGTESGALDADESTAGHNHAQMTAPMSILEALPQDWGRQGASVPSDILTLAEWPPRKEGEKWLREMKAARRDEVQHFERWSRMGWVPSTTPNWPTFVIGDQVIEPDNVESGALPGVTEDELPNVSGLGVKLRDPNLTDDEYRDFVRESMETVFDLFLVNTPWKDSRIGALMMASALRPCMPKRPHVPLYLVGAARSGKALPVDSYIPVPHSTSETGLARVADLAPGDAVFGSNGQATAIRSKSARHMAEVFDVYLSDGRMLRASDRHVFSTIAPGPARAPIMAELGSEAFELATKAAALSSGQAGRITDIAEHYQLPNALVADVIDQARIPSMPLVSDDASADFRPGYRTADIQPILDQVALSLIALSAETITHDDLIALCPEAEAELGEPTIRATGSRVDTIYPIGEVLTAYAESLINEGQVVTRSVTTAELGPGMTLAAITPDVGSWSANSSWFTAGVQTAESVAGKATSGETLADELVYGPIHDRLAFLRGFVACSLRIAGLPDLKLPSAEDEAIKVSDRGLRADIVTLMRSVGWSPMAASDGTILYRPISERASITAVVPAGQETCQCITVDRFDGQFAADNFVLTHNSWTAATAMSFWDKGKNWTEDTLPGSASDTKAATENAVSLAPIWVVDDLAPSSDPRKAEKEREGIEALLRAIHNNTGKRRSSGTGAQQDVRRPQAMLIATAENDIDIHSVVSRIISVRMSQNSLNTAAMEKMRSLRGTGEAPTVTAALIGFIANKRHLDDSEKRAPVKQVIEDQFDMLTGDLKYVVKSQYGFTDSEFERQAKLLADLMLIVQPLREMAIAYGVDQKYIDRLAIHAEGSLGEKVTSLVVESFSESRTGGPGHALLRAVKRLLNTKSAHIANASDPQMPPMVVSDNSDDAEAKAINSSLGWAFIEGQGARPIGKEIGVLYRGPKGQDDAVLLLDPATAFKLAQKESPELVPPGSGTRTAWQSMWDDGLAVEGIKGIPKRMTADSGTKRWSVQVMINGRRFSTVPVSLETLNSTL